MARSPWTGGRLRNRLVRDPAVHEMPEPAPDERHVERSHAQAPEHGEPCIHDGGGAGADRGSVEHMRPTYS